MRPRCGKTGKAQIKEVGKDRECNPLSKMRLDLKTKQNKIKDITYEQKASDVSLGCDQTRALFGLYMHYAYRKQKEKNAARSQIFL